MLLAYIVLAIAAIAAAAFWDEERESTAALEDFAEEQAVLAASVAADLSDRLTAARRDAQILGDPQFANRDAPPTVAEGYTTYRVRDAGAPAMPPTGDGRGFVMSIPVSEDRTVDLNVPPSRLLASAARVEKPGRMLLLVLPAGARALHGSDGRAVQHEGIVHALAGEQTWYRLARSEAIQLGLPGRLAIAGLARFDAGLGPWGVAVVASAERVRDREQRAEWRLVLGVLLTGGLVTMFGTMALRKQRRALELKRELALAELHQARDEHLLRASHAAAMGTFAHRQGSSDDG